MSRNRPPVPRAIDPRSGFDVPHSNLRRQYDGEFIDYRFIDKRNPQDLIRPRAERIALPNPRPEPPEVFIAGNILTEDGGPMFGGAGVALLTEGVTAEL